MKKDFDPLFRTSPFLDHNGPFYQKKIGEQLIVGLRILNKHVNGRGNAHAGILMTLADIAIGYQSAFSEKPPLNLMTMSLSNQFLRSAKLGDWLEAYVEIIKKGKNIVFAKAIIRVDSKIIMHSNAIYSVLN